MDDYWKEMEIIQHSGDAEPQDEVQLKVADGKMDVSPVLHLFCQHPMARRMLIVSQAFDNIKGN